MNIQIRTGFAAITHGITFQPQTVIKGQRLKDAGHCRNVVEHRCNGYSHLIEAKVIRQTSVTSPPYDVKLWINNTRRVTKVNCSCVYGPSCKCKHVACVIGFINSDQSKTKTSSEQIWGKPSDKKFVLEKYSKGRNFCQMFPPPPIDENVASVPLSIEEVHQPSALRQIMLAESRKYEDDRVVRRLVNDIVRKVDSNLREENEAACNEEESENIEACILFFNFYTVEYEVYQKYNFCSLSDDLKKYYKENIEKSEEAIKSICCETVDQSLSNKWACVRRLRISASLKVHQIKVRQKKPIESLVEEFLNPKCPRTPSLKYGNINEKCARTLYEELYSCKVYRMGVLLSKYQPWLCASLDGVVVIDGIVTKILEIKCPSSCENKIIVDISNCKCNVDYLEIVDNEVKLKESHTYYTQCQVQMYVSGVSECDFFVYTPIPNGSFRCTYCFAK